ncbi:hypothetical protein CAPTEDRAFT_226434 [Capitella teleta]|uniref:Glutathione peroxidase n=1 Tax=Capitella teleta TaxID=283909 RepID=R7U4U0_CAPTE|nr:hypothetical protein CAPTEDRAFT_226434 [Capitella teleta]|eukprot:ELU00949.1 hypothetical protein CAPTEDRAFT_226434 [Capitella teleta]
MVRMDWFWQAVLIGTSAIVFLSLWLYDFAPLQFEAASSGDQPKDWWKKAASIYEFKANDIDGNEVSLDKYNFIKWNFSKFLVDRKGQPVKRYAPNAEPNSFRGDIEKYLKESA